MRAALHGAGLDSERLVDVAVEPLESGTTSRARVRLTWAAKLEPTEARPAAAADTGRPTSVFVKLPADGTGARLFGTLVGLGANEVGFYSAIRPPLDLPAPRCYLAQRGRGGRFALVLEDLATTGVHFPTVADGCSADHAGAMMTALARVHAPLWASPRFRGDLRWVFRPADNDRVRRIQRLLLSTTLRRARGTLFVELGGEAGRLLDQAKAHDRALDAYRATGPTTLLHGDTHLGNTYALAEGTAGLYDWQVLQQGHGLRDVAYFTVLSTPVGLRRAKERAWLQRYVDELRALGVDAPDEDATWLHYRLYAVDALRGAAFTAAMGDRLQPEAQWRAGLERATTAVADLDTLGALNQVLGLG